MSPELHERIKKRAEVIYKQRLHWFGVDDPLDNWLRAEREVLWEEENKIKLR